MAKQLCPRKCEFFAMHLSFLIALPVALMISIPQVYPFPWCNPQEKALQKALQKGIVFNV